MFERLGAKPLQNRCGVVPAPSKKLAHSIAPQHTTAMSYDALFPREPSEAAELLDTKKY